MEARTQKILARFLVGAGILGAAIAAFVFMLGSTFAQSGSSVNGSLKFEAELAGANEVPAVETAATGRAEVSVNEDMTQADFEVRVNDGMAVTQSHLHCAAVGENGPVIVFLFGFIPGGFDVDGTLAEFTLTDANILPAGQDCAIPVHDIASLTHALQAGIIYANVHTVAYPAGEIRGQLSGDEIVEMAVDEDADEMMEEMDEMMDEMMDEDGE